MNGRERAMNAPHQSLRALDWVNFFLADVETGVGPFMATYFVSARHWNPAQVGYVLAAQKIASVLAQTPAGSLIDRSRRKKWLMAAASLAVGVGALSIALLHSVAGQVANQVLVGIATSVATPLIAAISLGIVGRAALGHRIGRNEGFNHSGNSITASLAGYLGYAAGLQSIFYVCGGLGIACAVTALLIRSRDISDDIARAAPENDVSGTGTLSLREVVSKPLVMPFAAVVVLFHIANAAMLPLVGEELGARSHHQASVYMSASIVLAQLIMIPVALASGRAADRIGRRPILLIGFTALVLRGFLFSLGDMPSYLVAVESLDGIGTGISGVITVLIISDLAKGTGRFNFLQGVVQACLGMGSFLGNLLGGLCAKSFGFPATFICLACIALAGLVLYYAKLPETRDLQSA
jgi:MFS family permease